MNQAAKKRLIRHAEHITAALPGDEHVEEVRIAVAAIQVFLDNKIGLASDAHLIRRLNQLSTEAITLDQVRSGETH